MKEPTQTPPANTVDREFAAALNELQEAIRLRLIPLKAGDGRQRVLYPARVVDRLIRAANYLGIARSELTDHSDSARRRKNGRKRATEARNTIAWAIPKVPDPAKAKLRAARAHTAEALR